MGRANNQEGNKNVKHSPDKLNKTKIFDKKKYRETKYSNQHKINKWESERKQKFLRELKNDTDVSKKFKTSFAAKTRGNQKFNKNQELKQKVLSEKLKKKEEIQRKQLEKEKALKKYKEKRAETYKKLCKKTKKGQPVMKDRMELLLQKIQSTIK
ncbi:thyroid transcription factor 1-associated protein 26 homolog [Microplitis mediator]|uniref:thyroid transcription factor 1-associated protein 26 homolog n=1 Tax=Microplitis mediator TaxID=375433 RepID=UPI002555B8B6|nr:thyroid transcription factor 1-associated protein 26 homolog [Microplitis mediator]